MNGMSYGRLASTATMDEAVIARREERGEPASRDAHGPVDVLWVMNSLSMGGSELKTVRLANAMLGAGVRSGVICLNEPDTLASALEAGVPRWRLDRAGKFSFTTVRGLRRLILSQRPRTVIAVNLYPALYMTAAVQLLGRRLRPYTVVLVNTSGAPGTMPWWRRTLYKSVLARAGETVHGCEAYRLQWGGGRSKVIYNGVDVEHFRPGALQESGAECRRRFDIPVERFVIGHVGRLAPEKNQEVLVETLRRLVGSGHNVHLMLVGDGPALHPLRARAGYFGLEGRVTFTGALEDVRPALKAMDVFVLPSLRVETFSNAALEAMSMGLPLILAEVGGAGEMVRNGVEGFVVPPAELPARLPALLAQLCADPARRERMSAAARERVVRQFSFEHMLRQYLALAGVERT